jgi:hypothetical protein
MKTECEEIADGLPMINIGRRVTMDEGEQVVDNIAEAWRDRVNSAFARVKC